jgi:6-phosphogluconolactonase (cycloisomerase 2 family)
MYYAQLDENGRVHTIQESSERINSPRAVQIDENDISLIGAYYNVSNGEFERREPEPEPEPTEQEVVNAELLLGQALMLESQLALERTAALILLETVRGEA